MYFQDQENWSPEEMVRIFFKFSRMIEKMKRNDGISLPEMMVFHSISDVEAVQKQEITAGDIAKKMEVTKSAVSQSINKLEERGLLERYYKKEDRRVTYVRLTEKGKERKKYNVQETSRLFKKAEMVMGTGDIETLTVLLEKFYQSIQESDLNVDKEKELISNPK